MGFKIKYDIEKQYLTSGSKRRSGIKMPHVGFMVAHDTGNPNSTASGNVGYYERSRNEMSASAHIFVDDKRIIECIPFLTGTPEKAWHVLYNVTKDNEMYGDDANDVAGGVELCYGTNIDSKEAYKRYIWVLAYACYKFNLNPAKMITGHEILDPKRKIDPSNGLKTMGHTYSQLLKDVVAEYNDCLGQSIATIAPTVTGGTYTIKAGDTFWSIAQNSNGAFTVQDLITWNPTVNAAELKVGQTICIKQPTKIETPTTSTSKKVTLPDGILKLGDKGSNVLAVQEALCKVNFYPEKGAVNDGCDSIYGAKTQNAVQRFQLVYLGQNDSDGIYGPKTKVKLEELINK